MRNLAKINRVYLGLGFTLGFTVCEIRHSMSASTLWMQPNNFQHAPMSSSRPNGARIGVSDVVDPDCVDLFARVKAGLLEDPNFTNQTMVGQSLFTRQTTTAPSFAISLHDRESDYVRWSIMDSGFYYEKFITRQMQFVLAQHHGGIFIDVGMNIGWFSLWGLSLGAEIYGFEPNPINRLRFCESIAMNKFPTSRIHLYSYALSNEEADMQLSHVPGNPGSAELVNSKQGKELSERWGRS